MLFLKEYFEKSNANNSLQMTNNHEKLPIMQRVSMHMQHVSFSRVLAGALCSSQQFFSHVGTILDPYKEIF